MIGDIIEANINVCLGGCHASIIGRGMTRAPVVRLPDARRAAELVYWIQDPANFAAAQRAFESTSRFARLKSVCACFGCIYILQKFNANLIYRSSPQLQVV